MELSIVGEFTEGKELMKVRRQNLMSEINKLEREHKKLKALPPTNELNRLESLRKKIPFYSISKTLPVRHNTGIIINGKILLAFMKKLKGFQYGLENTDRSLKLLYGRKFGEWTGELELFDISHHYEGFTDIPELEVIP